MRPRRRTLLLLSIGLAALLAALAVLRFDELRHWIRFGSAGGTASMAARLDRVARDAPASALGDRFVKSVTQHREEFARGGPRADDPKALLQLGMDLLKFGDPETAVAVLTRATELSAQQERRDAKLAHEIREALSTAWLRVGESENCIHCSNGASCLAPIEGGGVHAKPRGSERAIVEFEALLAEDPDEYDTRWLLNVAAMTLGRWPDGVDARWLLAPERFASEYPLPRFPNVAGECGVATRSVAGGMVTEDFDNDGFLDLLDSSQGLRDPLRLYRSNGDGTFTERAHEAGLDGIVGGLNLVSADYDNDGFADVLVVRGAWFKEGGCIPNSLLRNRGDGTFEDVTERAGILSFHPTQAALWADFDGDGWLDLYVGNETTSPDLPHPCELYHSNRDGTFTEVAGETGVAFENYVKGVCAGDYDDDGRIDLFVSTRTSPVRLLRNVESADRPGFRFQDVSASAGIGRPDKSFACWFFDYDNDGRLDIFAAVNAGFGSTPDDVGRFMFGVPTQSDRPVLYHNEGNGRFKDVAPELGIDRALLVMGSNYGDLDNDGWLDVYLGTGNPSYRALIPNVMFRNDRGRCFQDVTTAGGFGHLQKGHGVAFADLDNDGDQDVCHQLGGFFPGDVALNALFENPSTGTRWITLKLRGVTANRCAMGARIRVDVVTPEGERSIHVLAGTGGSFGSSSLQQEIGLGGATAIRAIEIRWPGSGTVQRFTDVAFDRTWLATEGQAALEPVATRSFKLGAR